jgi:hypothetical protein
MATVQYESKENAGHRFWTPATAATPSGSTPTGRVFTHGSSAWRVARSRNGVAPNRDEAAAEVSNALDELAHQKSSL